MKTLIAPLAALALLVVSCESADPGTRLTPAPAAAPSAAPTPAPRAASAETIETSAEDLATMKALYDKAFDALDEGHPTEAIKNFVTILGMNERLSPRPHAAAALAKKAEAELLALGSKMSLEASPEWIDSDGNMRKGSTRAASMETQAPPACILYANYGAGKIPVGDAPVLFEFVKNSGSATPRVVTDASGRANSVLSKIADPSKEAVLRASVVFMAKGYSWQFKGVSLDFTYLPPSNTAIVLSMSKNPESGKAYPGFVDAAWDALLPLGLELIPFDGNLSDADFMGAYAGRVATLSSLADLSKVSYFVFVYLENEEAKKPMLGGKPIAQSIYVGNASGTVRVVLADGAIAGTVQLWNKEKTQGNSPEDAYSRAEKDFIALLREELPKRIGELKKGML